MSLFQRGHTIERLSLGELDHLLTKLTLNRDAWNLDMSPKFHVSVGKTWYYDKETEEVMFGYRFAVYFPRSLWRTLGHTVSDKDIEAGLLGRVDADG